MDGKESTRHRKALDFIMRGFGYTRKDRKYTFSEKERIEDYIPKQEELGEEYYKTLKGLIRIKAG